MVPKTRIWGHVTFVVTWKFQFLFSKISKLASKKSHQRFDQSEQKWCQMKDNYLEFSREAKIRKNSKKIDQNRRKSIFWSGSILKILEHEIWQYTPQMKGNFKTNSMESKLRRLRPRKIVFVTKNQNY